jgi:RimJ/RimL family protein N-acetyltransferase
MTDMAPLSSLLPCELGDTRLRLFTASDLPRFLAYRSDAGLARFQAWSPMTEPEARQFVEEMTNVGGLRRGGWIQLAIADATSNRLVGDVGMFLSDDEREAELGFTLCREAQRQGRASAAARMATRLFFRCSRALLVRGVTDARNTASIRVLERAGFEKTSERRSEFKGELCLEWVYAFPRAEARADSSPFGSGP